MDQLYGDNLFIINDRTRGNAMAPFQQVGVSVYTLLAQMLVCFPHSLLALPFYFNHIPRCYNSWSAHTNVEHNTIGPFPRSCLLTLSTS